MKIHGCSLTPQMRAIEILLTKSGVDFQKIEIDTLTSGEKDKLPVPSDLDAIKKTPQLEHGKMKVIGDCPSLMRYLCQTNLKNTRGGTIEISNTTDYYPKQLAQRLSIVDSFLDFTQYKVDRCCSRLTKVVLQILKC